MFKFLKNKNFYINIFFTSIFLFCTYNYIIQENYKHLYEESERRYDNYKISFEITLHSRESEINEKEKYIIELKKHIYILKRIQELEEEERNSDRK